MAERTSAALAALLVGLASCASRAPAPATSAARSYGTPRLIHAWTRLAYDFPTDAEARAYEADKVYEKALLAGVRVAGGGRVFVTTPRWLDARVPATLSEVVTKDGAAVLRPFPSWADHRLGSPDALRNVLGVEIDGQRRMWILDMGWVAGVEPSPADAPRLVVLDLDSGATLARYTFPEEVASRTTSFLNDLAIDARRGLAYISDSGNRAGSPTDSGIIVYDLAANSARRILDRDPRVQDDPTRTLVVAGEPVFPGHRLAVGINGIALSADGERLFWSITTGDAIYDAPTAVLRDPAADPARVAAAVAGPRRIGGGSDGLATDARGRVYATNLARSAVEVFDPRDQRTATVASGPEFTWPDTLSWDDHGGLYVSTNHLDHGFAGTMRFDGPAPNFRIFRIQTDAGPQRGTIAPMTFERVAR